MKSRHVFKEGIPTPALLALGEQLRERRITQRLSQRELAELAGTTQANIALIEAGKGNPTYKTLDGVAAVLNSEVRMFISGGRHE